MNGKELKIYIKNIYELEASLYSQRRLYDDISTKIDNLNNEDELSMERKQSLSDYYDFNIGDFLISIVMFTGAGGVIGVIVGIIVGILQAKYDFRLGMDIFDWLEVGGIAAFIISSVVRIILFFVNLNRIKMNNMQIEKRNIKIGRYNEQTRMRCQRQIDMLNVELQKINKYYNATKNTLNVYYNKGIIASKYRNFIAISSFYDYFSSGICTQLEGHEGAYNKYDNELLLKTIISKLDIVIEKLDEIKNNQYMLYEAIHEGNKKIDMLSKEIQKATDKLDSIDKNTKLMAYYQGITARNSEFLTWLHTVNKY